MLQPVVFESTSCAPGDAAAGDGLRTIGPAPFPFVGRSIPVRVLFSALEPVHSAGKFERGRRKAEAATATPPLPLPDKPPIAVLPFENMSGDPE